MNQGVVAPKQFELIVIKRKKRKEFTQRTQRDHDEANARRRKFGIFYDQVYQILSRVFLGSLKQKELLDYALFLAQKHKLEIDRLSKRAFPCLVCWFCEHWSTISSDVYFYKNNIMKSVKTSSSNNNDTNSSFQNTHEKNPALKVKGTDEELPSEPISPNPINLPNSNSSNFSPIQPTSSLQEQNMPPLPQANTYTHKILLPSISSLMNCNFLPNELSIASTNNESLQSDSYESLPTHIKNNTVLTDDNVNNKKYDNESGEHDKSPYIPLRFRNFLHDK